MIVDSRTVGAFQENAFLVVDEATNRAALIDPGADPDELIDMIERSGATLDAIWLTHGHLDHIGGISGVLRRYSVPVYMHPADLPLYLRGTTQAAIYGVPFEQPEPPDRSLAEGDTLNLGSLSFDVYHLPGHSPGHVVFRHGDVVFGGDVLFAGSRARRASSQLVASASSSIQSACRRRWRGCASWVTRRLFIPGTGRARRSVMSAPRMDSSTARRASLAANNV